MPADQDDLDTTFLNLLSFFLCDLNILVIGSVKGVLIFDIVVILFGVESSLVSLHFHTFWIFPELLNTTPTFVSSGFIDLVGDNSQGSRGICSFSESLFPNFEVSSFVVDFSFSFCFLTILPLLVRVHLFSAG